MDQQRPGGRTQNIHKLPEEGVVRLAKRRHPQADVLRAGLSCNRNLGVIPGVPGIGAAKIDYRSDVLFPKNLG